MGPANLALFALSRINRSDPFTARGAAGGAVGCGL